MRLLHIILKKRRDIVGDFPASVSRSRNVLKSILSESSDFWLNCKPNRVGSDLKTAHYDWIKVNLSGS